MNKQLVKYQIGLAVIGVFALVMLIIVVVRAGGIKHDNETYEKANKIATKLDSYVTSKGTPPNSLADAGINDVPEEVTYKKLSSTRYEYCVDYSSNGDGYSSTYIANQLFSSSQSSQDYGQSSSVDSSYLYLSPVHHKGKNCQTVKTYNYFSGYPQTPDYDTQSF